MAAVRGALLSLNNVRNSTAILPSSSFSSSVIFTYKYDFYGRDCSNRHFASIDTRSQGSAPDFLASYSIRNCVRREGHCLTKNNDKYRQKFQEECRLHMARSGSSLASIRGFIWGERSAESLYTRKFTVITADGIMNLSRESNCGQIPGTLHRNCEDLSSDGSFASGSCHSCQEQEHSAFQQRGSPPSNATISEANVGVMEELEDALGFPLGQGPQAPIPRPLVIVVSGPSGVGKDAVIKKLQQARRDIHFVVTATTRPRRPNEIDGVDYHFMSKLEFQDMIENHELLEHATVYGDYKGIPKQQVREFMSQGKDVVLRIDVQGAATVRSILGSEAVFIFLVAESEKSLVKRLIERKTETMDKMLVRVATAREELNRMEEFDYVVVNEEGCLDRTVSLISSIIDAEKTKVKPKIAEI